MTAPSPEDVSAHRTAALRALVDNIEQVVTGKRRVVELVVVAVGAGGHVLLEDVPGVGKTVLARALARSIDGRFARVQGAPDLLPADVTGSSVYDQHEERFRFVPGPIFANVVLVDELNRTTPRSQAALLEAMEEGQVSVDGTSHPLPVPNVVIATQNPLEHIGTFPLPESQLDRFSIATSVGYPSRTDEVTVVRAQVHTHPLERLQPVLTTDQVAWLVRAVRAVHVSDEAVDYAVRVVEATRDHDLVELGASPRATVQLVHAAQSLAALRGRDHVLPDDVKELAPAVLPHRLVLHRGAGAEHTDRRALVQDLVRSVAVGGVGASS
ncbi:MAG: AAA family ATPase [Actinomycetes bacterium]